MTTLEIIESIRARHLKARPHAPSNPAFANADLDIGVLLAAYDLAFADGVRMGLDQGCKIAERILDELKRNIAVVDQAHSLRPLLPRC